jgi:predicted dinucleotide-binding enzyme
MGAMLKETKETEEVFTMRIGMIGSGHIGGTLAKLWAQAGHQVALSNSRGPSSLADLVQQIGHGAQGMIPEEAAAFGEVVLVAIPFGKYKTLPVAPLAGKVVIDAMNYYQQRDGQIEMRDLASSELIARYLPQSRVIKAFNTMHYQTLATEGRRAAPQEDRLVIFTAGDAADAKATVAHLIEEIGFAPVDTGSLHEGGRKQQPGSPIYNRPMTLAEARKVMATL